MMAAALRDWLPLVLYYVKPWVSGKDIQAGERWSLEVGKELEESNFGILCLTKDNLSAPWMLFEAGALSKAISAAAVCPYILDAEFRDITGPLSQFQSKKTDDSSTLELLQAMNKSAPDPMEEPRLTELFEVLWPKLEQELGKIPKAQAQGAAQSARPEAEVLEELVASVRTMDRRFDGLENIVNRIFEVAAGTAVPQRTVRPLEELREERVRLSRDRGDTLSLDRAARAEDLPLVPVVVMVREETPKVPADTILNLPASAGDPRAFIDQLRDETGIDVLEDRGWNLYDPRNGATLRVLDTVTIPDYFKGESAVLELVKI